MTTTDAKIVPATRYLQDQVRYAVGGQAPDLFDKTTPVDPGKHMFHHDARHGEEVIEEAIPHPQGLALRVFLGCGVRTPAGS